MSDELDLSLFEVFLGDARKISKALGDGLLALAGNVGDVDRASSLMRLAHSLKGAASSIVSAEGFPELSPLASMAQSMEACFNALKAGRISLGSRAIGELLEGVGQVAAMAEIQPQELKGWLLPRAKSFESLAFRFSEIEKGHASLAPEPVKEPAAAPGSGSAGAPEPASSAQSQTASGPLRGELADLSLVGLFKVEAETQAALLMDGVMKLEASPSSAGEALPSLMRAAHSLKGAARIIQLEEAVALAHAMESCFVAAIEGALTLEESHFDLLLEGVDLIAKLSSLEEREIPRFAAEGSARFKELASAYASFKPEAGGSSSKGSSAVAAPPPAPAKASPAPESPASSQPSSESQPAPARTSAAETSKEVFVRVGAERLNKLLGLAGESIVDARKMRSLESELLALKAKFSELAAGVERSSGAAASSSDDSLPELRQRQDSLFRDINALYTGLSDFLLKMDNFSSKLYNEVFACRIRPFEDGVGGFPRMVRDVSKRLGKKAKLEISGRRADVDRDLLERLEAPLNHLLRNAVDHGLESPEERVRLGKPDCGLIQLSAYHWAGFLNVKVGDDGRGIDIAALRRKVVQKGLATSEMAAGMSDMEVLDFLFLPGFSTAQTVTEISGRGVGLDVVLSMIQEVRGSIKIETKLGQGTCFHLQLPVALSVISALLVEIGGEPYAFPLVRMERLLKVRREELRVMEGRHFVSCDGANVGVVSAREMLGLPLEDLPDGELPLAVIGDKSSQYAILVDSFIGEREIVVRPMDERLGKLGFISAASLCDDGSPLLILDVDDMLRSIDGLLKGGSLRRLRKSEAQAKGRKRVLVADDSLTVRELERNLLSNAGYEVDVAIDGAEAWNALRLCDYDLVVTDVDMPRMNGFELVENVKSNERLKGVPVVIVSYKDREEDRLKGLEAGADYYLTKGSFHDNSFIDAVNDLTGGKEP